MALYLVLVLTPAATVWATGGGSSHGWQRALGHFAGLTGLGLLVGQFLLAARLRFLDRLFGLDAVLAFHRYAGVLACVLLLLHPTLLAWSTGTTTLLFGTGVAWYLWVGRAALLVLLLLVGGALFRRVLGLRFETWRRGHDAGALVVLVLVGVHATNVGGDRPDSVLPTVWSVLVTAALLAFLLHRVAGPLLRRRNAWAVRRVQARTPQVTSLELAPPAGERMDASAGQFAFLTPLRSSALPHEEHHFTLSSSPHRDDGHVGFTIKALGDFTGAVPDVVEGDEFALQGPFGAFTHERYPEEDSLLFVAGGIGITPCMSMLRALRDTEDSRPRVLVYANDALEDVVFREELRSMAADPAAALRLVEVLAEPPDDWDGRRGHVDDELLAEALEGLGTATGAYVCGPAPMRRSVVAELRELGVPRGRIHAEAFDLERPRVPGTDRDPLLLAAVAALVAVVLAAGSLFATAGAATGDGHDHDHDHGSLRQSAPGGPTEPRVG